MTTTDATTWRDCRCGAKIEPARSGTYWIDIEGWDNCIGTEDSHGPSRAALHHQGDAVTTQLTRKERAINNMQCRMSWSEAERYATELDLRGFLESGDKAAAIEFLAGHMPQRRAEGVVHDLIMCRIMWHPDYV